MPAFPHTHRILDPSCAPQLTWLVVNVQTVAGSTNATAFPQLPPELSTDFGRPFPPATFTFGLGQFSLERLLINLGTKENLPRSKRSLSTG